MEIKEAYDKHCKRILSDKRVLCNIMKECIPEYKNMTREDIFLFIEDGGNKRYIKGLPNEDFKIDNAVISYDILFTSRLPDSKDEISMYINIEAQNNSNPGYPLINRATYYSSRIIAKQKGEIFKHSNYKELKKVYSIWICINPNKKYEDTINYYTFNENKLKGNSASVFDYRLINVIMLNVGHKYDYKKGKTGVLEMLNLLFHKNELSREEVKLSVK